jgi:2-dehydro-3-deoxygluconokinase
MNDTGPVVTIGETMMVFNGPADVPVGVGTPLAATFAGAESNVAIGLARLGHAVRYLSVFGEDVFGQAIVRTIRGEGVGVSGVRFDGGRPTGVMVKNRWPGDEPQVMYYRSTSAFAGAGTGTFDAAAWRDARVIFLTGITPALSDGCLEMFRSVLHDARSAGIPVWLDPNFRGKLWSPDAFRRTLAPMLSHVDTVLPSVAEGEMLTGKAEPGEMACRLMGMGVKNVIVKAGDAGAMAYTGGETVSVPPLRLGRIVDPIGAGDGFAAGYLSGWLEGLSVEERLRRGHAVAAHVCLTVGDWEGLPTRGEVERFVAGRGGADR